MWTFLSAHLNWMLGLLTFLLWGGAFTWYVGPMIRTAWRTRGGDPFDD